MKNYTFLKSLYHGELIYTKILINRRDRLQRQFFLIVSARNQHGTLDVLSNKELTVCEEERRFM